MLVVWAVGIRLISVVARKNRAKKNEVEFQYILEDILGEKKRICSHNPTLVHIHVRK